MVRCGMVNVDLYSAIITKVCNALNTPVSVEKPGFQALSKGLVVLLCAEVVWQRVPDHGAVHSVSCNALALVKARLVLPFWYRLTRVVLDKGPLNWCVCVCVASDNDRR